MRIGATIAKAVVNVTKEWTSRREKEFRKAEKNTRSWNRLIRKSSRGSSLKAIAYDIMPEAYRKASGDGQWPAQARQIFYQARPLILEQTGRHLGKEFDEYFTRRLLPDFMAGHPDEIANWDVVFDARGHLWEPHTEREIPLGTISVRQYLSESKEWTIPLLEDPTALTADYPTLGPRNRFRNVLFIEKEGFMPLIEAAKIAERFDLAIMSTKGLASTAAVLS